MINILQSMIEKAKYNDIYIMMHGDTSSIRGTLLEVSVTHNTFAMKTTYSNKCYYNAKYLKSIIPL